MNNNEFTLHIIAALNKQLSKQRINSDLKSMDNSMYIKIISKLAITLSRKQLKTDLQRLNNLYLQIGAGLSTDKAAKEKLQNQIKQLQKNLDDLQISVDVADSAASNAKRSVSSAIKSVQQYANKTPISLNVEILKEKAVNDILYMGKKYSKLFSNISASQKYQNLLDSAYSISDQSQLQEVRAQIAAFTSELKTNGLACESTGSKWKRLVDRSKELFSAANIVATIFSQVKKSVSAFLELDTAMTNLYKVTDEITSRDQFTGLLTKWNKLAQNLSVSTESLINSMSEWHKRGLDLNMSEQLAQITAIFEKTAAISNKNAISTLMSVAQAFPEIDNLDEDDYIERVQAIGDKINTIGNKFAIDTEGMSDALQNSAAALQMANNDLDESIAIVAAASKIFQNPDEISNIAKILSARLRGQKEELAALNEDTEGMIESVSKIQTKILNLTQNKVNIFEDDNETLKSTYQIMLEIGKVFNNLSDRSQADLLETISGKQQMSSVASLLLNYEELEKIKEESINSVGSMSEEYSKYLESAEAHITTFQQKLIETYSTFMSGDLIKYTADIGSGILDLVNFTDLLKHSIVAVLALNIGKGISAVGAAIASTSKQMHLLGSALQQVKRLPADDILREASLEKVGGATKNLTEKNLKLLLSQKQLEDSDKLLILRSHSLNEEEARTKLEKMGLISATKAQAAANVTEAATTTKLKNAMLSLKASISGVWASIKAAFASNSLGMGLMVLSTVISVTASAISKYHDKLEETRRKNIEAADAASENASKLTKLYTEYNRLASIQDRTTSEEEAFKTAVENITAALGTKAELLKDLTVGTDEYAEALARATKEELQSNAVQATIGRKESEEELQNAVWGMFHSKIYVNSNDSKMTLPKSVTDTLEKYEVFDEYGNVMWKLPSKNPVEILEFYNALTEAREKLVLASKEDESLLDTDTYHNMNIAINAMSESLDTYIEKLYEEEKLNYMAQNGIPKTSEEYQSMKSVMEAVTGESIDLQKEFANLLAQDFSSLAAGMNQVADAGKAIHVEIDGLNSQPVSVFAISDDDVTTLSDYQSNLDKIQSSLQSFSSLQTSDILSLMTTFKDYAYVFEDFGVTGVKGVGDLQGALRKLTQVLYENALKACPQMADAIKSMFSSVTDGTQQIHDLEADIEELDSIINKVSSGQSLNTSEVSNLINKYGDLNNAVIVTTEGYQFEIETLENLKNSKISESNTAIAKQIEQTENVIAQIRSRIEAYKLEKQALDELTRAYTNKQFSTIDDYISQYGEMAAYEVFGSDAVDSYYKNGIANVELDMQLKKLDGLQNKLNSIPTRKSSSSSSGSSSSETIFDWIETKIQRTEESIDRLNQKLESVSDYTHQNQYIDETLKAYEKELQLLEESRQKYLEKAEAAGLSAVYIDKIKNGNLEIESISNEAVKKKIEEYQKWYEKAENIESSIKDITARTKELNRQKLDNLINDYDRTVSLANAYSDYLQKLLDIKEAKKDTIAESDYLSLMQQELNIQATLTEQYKKVQNKFNELNLSPSDDAWYEYQEELVSIQTEIADCTYAAEQFRDAILEIRWSNFETGMSLFDDLSDEISDVISLIGDGDMFDNGEISDYGITKLGLYAQQYVTAKKQIAEYENAIKKLGEMYKNGAYSQEEYTQKLMEFRQASRDAALSVKTAKEEILSFHKEAVQAEIDAMKELVDAKKEALDAEKDLYDYRKSISDKQKNIQSLEKKIATLSLSDARADKALKLQLEEELAKAKEELADEEREHSIENQKNALDKEYENFEKEKNEELKELENNLDKQEDLIGKYLNDVIDNYDIVYDNIQKISDKFGITFTESLTSPWETAANAAQLYSEVVGQILSQLEINSGSIGAGMNGTSLGTTYGQGQWVQETNQDSPNYQRWWYIHADGSYTQADWEYINGKWYCFDKDGWMGENEWVRGKNGEWYYLGSDGAMVSGGWHQIDGKWYCFDKEGKMYQQGYTPDGYQVDDQGVWDEQPARSIDELKNQNISPASYADYAKESSDLADSISAVWAEDFINITGNPFSLLNGINFNAVSNIPAAQSQPVNLNITSPLMVVNGGLDSSIMAEVDRKLNRLPDEMMQYLKCRNGH